MKKQLVSAAVVALVSAGTLALGPSAEAAAPVRTKVDLSNQVGFTGSGDAVFRGTVASPRRTCVGGRTVVLTAAEDGQRYGRAKVKANGSFRIVVPTFGFPSDGRFTATAARTKVGKVVCAAGRDTVNLT